MAVSLYHHGDNIDRTRVAELTGAGEPSVADPVRPPAHEWLMSWIEADDDPRESMDSLPGVMWHLSDAWSRRNQANVVLVHYGDLYTDLDGQMRRLARDLDISVSEDVWPDLVESATFIFIREHAEALAPDHGGILKDPASFFRHGRPGAARHLLTDDEIAAYEARASKLAPRDLLAWLHSR